MRFALHQASRKGGRERNEDRVGHCYGQRCGVFVLADGMGGHPRGEVAARLAVETTIERLRQEATPVLADPARFLAEAAEAAHRRLCNYTLQEVLDDAPRTTFVACMLQDGAACWAHCGDSRFYLVRGGALVGRTRDHSYVERQQSLDPLGRTDERYSRNVLYTCLGGPAAPSVDVAGPLPLQPGDRLLLCSDGLWDNVADAIIAERLAARPLGEALSGLVELALRRGGLHCDNVSVLGIEWEPPAADAVVARAPAGDDFVCDVGPVGPDAGASGPAAQAAALARRAWGRRGR